MYLYRREWQIDLAIVTAIVLLWMLLAPIQRLQALVDLRELDGDDRRSHDQGK